MVDPTALLTRQPIRDVRVRCGTQTNCGGLAGALIDIEPHLSFAPVRTLPADLDANTRGELLDACVTHFETGVREALLELCGQLPPVRVVLRWILVHEVESTPARNRQAGRLAVLEALRRVSHTESGEQPRG